MSLEPSTALSSQPSVPPETSTSIASDPRVYPILGKDVMRKDLPFIDVGEVKHRDGKSGRRLWIVIDDVVYDCSEFRDTHPGGDEALDNFGGQNCSWQFWNIHPLPYMKNYGEYLRVGRTEGLENKHPLPRKLRGWRPVDYDG